jgi:hypothetical protein
LGWKVKPNDCISEVNEVQEDCFPLITSTSNDVNNLNNRIYGAEMVQFCSPKASNMERLSNFQRLLTMIEE